MPTISAPSCAPRAFFGVKAIVLPDHPAQALPGEAAWRVAEGGMEICGILPCARRFWSLHRS